MFKPPAAQGCQQAQLQAASGSCCCAPVGIGRSAPNDHNPGCKVWQHESTRICVMNNMKRVRTSTLASHLNSRFQSLQRTTLCISWHCKWTFSAEASLSCRREAWYLQNIYHILAWMHMAYVSCECLLHLNVIDMYAFSKTSSGFPSRNPRNTCPNKHGTGASSDPEESDHGSKCQLLKTCVLEHVFIHKLEAPNSLVFRKGPVFILVSP